MQFLKEKFRLLKNNPEPLIFFLVCVWFVGPAMSVRFFLTTDGAAHVYNADVISAVLFDGSSNLAKFYELTPYPVPNWFAHAALMVLQFFMKAEYAWKVLHIIYVFAFAYGFRYLMRALNDTNRWATYFIFPYIYNLLFFMGFYSFLFSLVFMFVLIGFWIRHENALGSRRAQIVLCLLFLLTWFSHFAGFCLAVISIGCYEFLRMFFVNEGQQNAGARMMSFLKRTRFLILPVVIPAVCTVFYYANKNIGKARYLDFDVLVEWLGMFQTFMVNVSCVAPYTDFFFCMLFLVPLAGIAYTFRRRKEGSTTFRALPFVFTLTMVVLFIALTFILPDEDGSGGMITIRLLFLFYLFTPLLIGTTRFTHRVGIPLAVVMLFIGWSMNKARDPWLSKTTHFAGKVMQVGEKIEPGTSLQAFVLDPELNATSISALPVAGKDIVLLNNYEVYHDYFPQRMRNFAMGAFKICGRGPDGFKDLAWFGPDPGFEGSTPEYVMFIGYHYNARDPEAADSLIQLVKGCYDLVEQLDEVSLYRLKDH